MPWRKALTLLTLALTLVAFTAPVQAAEPRSGFGTLWQLIQQLIPNFDRPTVAPQKSDGERGSGMDPDGGDKGSGMDPDGFSEQLDPGLERGPAIEPEGSEAGPAIEPEG